MLSLIRSNSMGLRFSMLLVLRQKNEISQLQKRTVLSRP